MTQSTNKTMYLDGSFISVHPDGDMDKIVVRGAYLEEDYYPVRTCHIGLSDGTLLIYDASKQQKLEVLQEGYGYIAQKYTKKMYAKYVEIDEDVIDWIVFGDIE